MDYRKPNYAGFIALASGPVGGSLLSLQQALEILLEGACYNFKDVEKENVVEELHWKKVYGNKVADKEWINFLFSVFSFVFFVCFAKVSSLVSGHQPPPSSDEPTNTANLI